MPRAGIPERRFHDLRATAATILQDQGVEESVRMARLGHSTTKITRHYAKVGDELDRDAARRIGEALG